MNPKEQLLYFIGAGAAPVDPIRIMKGLFVFTQRAREGALPGQEAYFDFQPMNYGPCAPGIYQALRDLVAEGLVQEVATPGETWSRYVVSGRGRAQAGSMDAQQPTQVTSYLKALRQWCDQHNFQSLLKSVYHTWPEYAAKSVLPHLRPNG